MRYHLLFVLLWCSIGSMAKMDPQDYARLKAKTDVYFDKVQAQPDWLYSRLQMYWKSHATDVYVQDDQFHHIGGSRAPEPTVKFSGQRNHVAPFGAPALDDVVPYDDDEQGNVTFASKSDGHLECVSPVKTGVAIASLNQKIISIARDAARLYAENGDERYARMAFDVFDTYVKGIYYRNVPTDMDHGHLQTLISMTTFEVIHEEVITSLTELYACLKRYEPCKSGSPLYDAALKKWAENLIANGVPHNNWNLFQADFIAKIALVLNEDATYQDGRGRQYYLDYIVNKSSIRQWSMQQLAAFGFDPQTAIWYESPGYSSNAVIDVFVGFADMLDREAGIDLFRDIPILLQAVKAKLQYLMPNRMICGFGDTHPNYLSTKPVDTIIAYARRHQKKGLQQEFETLRAAILPDATEQQVSPYVSPVFYAPNVSWLIQRTGMNPQHDLAVSLNGSLGNHQHANGISMELYGKGYVLGPDAGIGRALYGGDDYKEYYSRFPAHNTVCVDGVSDYPVMMSQHAFSVEFLDHTDQASVSQVSFVEPETQSDQLRTNGIVTTPHGGYYVDVFRSRRRDGKDRFHDYFYHNLGQSMTLTAASGADLGLQPTDELAFAGGHLYAYSYIYDKFSATTSNDVKATFTTACPDGRQIDMTMWMQGSPQREVFRALSPVNMEYERLGSFMPYNVKEQPVLTFVARQQGDAWTKPFVAVFEPSDSREPSDIQSVEFFTPSEPDAVGIRVTLKNGRVDTVISTPDRYQVVSDGKTVISQTCQDSHYNKK